jgi:hypothetical protein
MDMSLITRPLCLKSKDNIWLPKVRNFSRVLRPSQQAFTWSELFERQALHERCHTGANLCLRGNLRPSALLLI